MKGGNKMKITDAQKKATKKYFEKIDEIKIRVTKGQKAVIKAHAKNKGLSLNAYIVDLIEKDIH